MKKVIKNRYEILKKIGYGSMSEVYLARDISSDENYTLKKFRIDAIENRDEALMRFNREIHIISGLSHPNIIQLKDFLHEGEDYYLVTEYFDGKKLQEQSSQFTLNEKIEIIKKCSDALAYIHNNGIIHRDLKPDNILVGTKPRQELKIIDFGLAYLVNLNDVFKKDTIVGSFAYISPEQTGFLKRDIDKRSDLYSLGATFYEFLTGRPPFLSDDIGKLIYRHIAKRPVRPSAYNSEIPPIIDEIILKLLNKEPEERYQSGEGLSADLEKYLNSPDTIQFQIAEKDVVTRLNSTIKIVGQEEILERLKDFHADVSLGTPKTVLVLGKIGYGKSKLAEAFKEEIITENTQLLYYKCSASTMNIPYAPFVALIEDYFKKAFTVESQERILKFTGEYLSTISDIYPGIADFFGNDINFDNNIDHKKKSLLFIAIQNLFYAIGAGKNDVLITIDDIHYADTDSIELLSFLSHNLENTRIMFLLCSDIDKEEKNRISLLLQEPLSVEVVELKGLEKKYIPEFISRLLGKSSQFAEDFYSQVYENSLGVPFFIVENIKSLYESNILKLRNNFWEVDNEKLKHFQFETNIYNAMLKRLASLSESEKKILALAALIGKEFDIETLNKLMGKNGEKLDNLIAIIDKCKDEQLIEEIPTKHKGTYSFAHEKIIETLENVFSEKEKESYNLACAQNLEQRHKKDIENQVFNIAFYYNRTENVEKKLFYNQLAYQTALKKYSTGEAIFYLKLVVDYYIGMNDNQNDKSVSLLFSLSTLLQLSGKIEESFQYLNNAMQIVSASNNKKLEIETDLRFGTGYYYLNDQINAYLYYERAMTLANELNIEVQIPMPYVLMGSTLFFSTQLYKASEYFNKAIRYSNKENFLREIVTANGLNSWCNLYLGRFEEAIKNNEIIEKLIPEIEDPLILMQAYHCSATFYITSGIDYKNAYCYSKKTYEISKKTNQLVFTYSSLITQAYCHLVWGEYEKALEQINEGLEISKKNNILIGIENFHACLGLIYLSQGEFEKANKIAEEYLAEKDKISFKLSVIQFLHIHAAYLYINDFTEESLKYLDETLRIYRDTGFLNNNISNLYFRSYLLEKLGKKEQAKTAYDEIISIIKDKPGFTYQLHDAIKNINEYEEAKKPKKPPAATGSSTNAMFKEYIQFKNIVHTSQTISSILELDKLLETIMDEALEVSGAERGILILYNSKNCSYDYKIRNNFESHESNFEIPNSILNAVTKKKKGVVFQNAFQDPRLCTHPEITQQNIRSIICAPLLFEERLLGMIYLDSKLLQALFSDKDLEILSVFTAQAAISIVNAEKNAIIHKQFSDSVNIIYSLMAKSATRVYEYTQEVTRICVLLARKLKLSSADVENIRIAAMLQDIGMIGLIEKLLYSKKILTEAEKKIIRSHPDKSVEIIDRLEGIDKIKKMIIQHQERYDGTGYPAGLSRDEIQIGARIINIIDDFVMMLRNREYQTINKKEKIVSELKKNRGLSYDPYITDLLIELIDEENLIYLVNKDDVKIKHHDGTKIWQIPSNVNFETILVEKIMEEINSTVELDPDLSFSMDYSLCEAVRNAIIHGNKYNENKFVTVTLNFAATKGRISSIKISIFDEGEGMDINEYNRFNESRKKLFSIINSIRDMKEKHAAPEHESELDDILTDLNMFKMEYYTDYNTFRQFEEGDISGGVGLLQVMTTFDNVEFKNTVKDNTIKGLELILEKYL